MDPVQFQQLLLQLNPNMTAQAIAQFLGPYLPLFTPTQLGMVNATTQIMETQRITLATTGVGTVSTGGAAGASGGPVRRDVASGLGNDEQSAGGADSGSSPGGGTTRTTTTTGGAKTEEKKDDKTTAAVTPAASAVRDITGNIVQLDSKLRGGLTPEQAAKAGNITERSAKDVFGRSVTDRAGLVARLYKEILQRDASANEQAGYHGMHEEEIKKTLSASQEKRNLDNPPVAPPPSSIISGSDRAGNPAALDPKAGTVTTLKDYQALFNGQIMDFKDKSTADMFKSSLAK